MTYIGGTVVFYSKKMTMGNYLTHDWYAIKDYERCKTCNVMCICESGNMIATDNSTCAEVIMKEVML